MCLSLGWPGMSRSSPSFRTCHLMQTHLVPITSTFVLPTSVSIPYLSLSLCGQAWQEGVHHGNHIIRCIPSCYPSLIFFFVNFHDFLYHHVCWRPYHVECTGSLLTSEVKRHRARLVLGWGTAWEHPRVLPAFLHLLDTLARPMASQWLQS